MTERQRTIHWQDPRIGGRAAGALSGLDYLRQIEAGELPPPPIMALVDFRLVELERGRIAFEFTPEEFHYNPIGSVHGGIPSTLLDSAMGCAVHTTLPAGARYSTLDLHVRFVRPIRAGMGPLRCEGRVIHPGRKHATAEADLRGPNGALHAHATCACLISEAPEA